MVKGRNIHKHFKNQFSTRYTELRSTTLSEENIFGVIDSIATYLGPAIDRNFAKWPILGTYVWPNYYIFDTYEEEVDYLKEWITDRLEWIDSQSLNEITGDINLDNTVNIQDIILLVSIILNDGYNILADLNFDGTVDILDAVALINIILYS